MTNTLKQPQLVAEVISVPEAEPALAYFQQLAKQLKPDNYEQTAINDHGHSYAMFIKDVARELVLGIVDKLLSSAEMLPLREYLQGLISEPYSVTSGDPELVAQLAYVAADLQEIIDQWQLLIATGFSGETISPRLLNIAHSAYKDIGYYASRQALTLLGESLVLDPELYLFPLLDTISGYQPAELSAVVDLVKQDGLIKRRFASGQELDPLTHSGLEHLLVSAHNREKVNGSTTREQLETSNLEYLQEIMPDAAVGTTVIEWSDPYHEHQVRTMVRIHRLAETPAGRQWESTILFVPYAKDGYTDFQEQVLREFSGAVVSQEIEISENITPHQQSALSNLSNMTVLPQVSTDRVLEFLPLAETKDNRPQITRMLKANDDIFDRATHKFHQPLLNINQQIITHGINAALSGDTENFIGLANQLQATIHTARLTTLPQADLIKAGLKTDQIQVIRNNADRLTQLAATNVGQLQTAISEISSTPFSLTNINGDCVRDNYVFGTTAPSAPKVVSSMSGSVNESGKVREVKVELVQAAGANGDSIYYLKACPKCNRQRVDICTSQCTCGFPIGKLVEVCSSPSYQGNRGTHISKLLQKEMGAPPKPAVKPAPIRQAKATTTPKPAQSGVMRDLFHSFMGMYLPFSTRGLDGQEA